MQQTIHVTLPNFDDTLFKRQRRVLNMILSDRCITQFMTTEMEDTLLGIEAMCDEIADQAHDEYGMNTLYLSENGEELCEEAEHEKAQGC